MAIVWRFLKWGLAAILVLILIAASVFGVWFHNQWRNAAGIVDGSHFNQVISAFDTKAPLIASESLFAKAAQVDIGRGDGLLCSTIQSIPSLLLNRNSGYGRPVGYFAGVEIANEAPKRDHLERAFIGCVLEARFDDAALFRAQLSRTYFGMKGGEPLYGVDTASSFLFDEEFKSLDAQQVIELAVRSTNPRGATNDPEWLERSVERVKGHLSYTE